MLRSISIGSISLLLLAACVPPSSPQSPEIDGDYTWVSRTENGFNAIVPADFSPENMRREFGSYCDEYNKVTRSLIMEEDADGNMHVIGECLS